MITGARVDQVLKLQSRFLARGVFSSRFGLVEGAIRLNVAACRMQITQGRGVSLIKVQDGTAMSCRRKVIRRAEIGRQ